VHPDKAAPQPTRRQSSARDSKLTKPQGDLGHTDLQEDLEFHSSSKHFLSSLSPLLPLHHLTKPHPRLRHATLLRPRRPQNPTRLVLCVLPARPRHLKQQPHKPKALLMVPKLLRASLRRRHSRSPAPLHIHHLPTRQLPRRARGEPRSLRPCMDRHNGYCDLVPYRHD
jgi:hypothetical protein